MIYTRNAKRLKNEKFDDFFERVFLFNFYYISTYHDDSYTKKQCNTGCYRSFEDILEIARTYYHNITESKVAKLIAKNKSRSFLYCPGVKKWVLTNSETNCGVNNLYNYSSCKSFTNKVGENGRYSFDMIKELINK